MDIEEIKEENLDSPLVVHKKDDASYQEANTEVSMQNTHVDEDSDMPTLERHRFKKEKKKKKWPYVLCILIASFFQISKFGTFERLDVLHISFWIMGVFVKAVTALYCASSCISKKPKRSFVFASSFIVFVISVLILKLSGGQGVNYEFTMILFFVFCVIIPLGTLVFKKKNYGDELVKAY